MRTLILLNPGSLRRWGADLPHRLMDAATENGPRPRVVVSRSTEHMIDVVSEAIESGTERVVAGGGDGTLHYVVNHPLIERVQLGMLPCGTVNAFWRDSRVPVAKPEDCLRLLLSRGRSIEGYVGRLNGRRFACFASLGFDAHVCIRNSPALKRLIHGASYVVTGLKMLTTARRDCRPGRMKLEPGENTVIRTSSLVVSKIGNYARCNVFETSIAAPSFQILGTRQDTPSSLLGMWIRLATVRSSYERLKKLPRGVFHREGITRILWRSDCPVHVQVDGDALKIERPDKLKFDIDPVPQRYLVP